MPAASSGRRSGSLLFLWLWVLRPVLLLLIGLAAATLLAILAWKTPAALANLLSFLGSENSEAQTAELGRLFLVLLGFALAVFALWKVPQVQAAKAQGLSRKERAEFENAARGTLGQIVNGTVLIIGIIFTWGTLQVAQQNAEIAREGQVTDRFTRAVGQLGSMQLESRLGGIYALERLAQESERDRWPIMQVLTAYVRGAPREGNQPPADIQAIVAVIAASSGSRQPITPWPRQEHHLFPSEPIERLNLRGAYLRGADLRRPVGRQYLNLQGAYLSRADLQDARLYQPRLEWADLSRGNLQRAWFANAYLREARLICADLRGATLFGAEMQWSRFGTGPEALNIVGYDVETGTLGATLDGATLTGAYLENAYLQWTSLRKTDLRNATMWGANLEGAILDGADLRGAVGLTQEQIDRAIVTEEGQDPLLPEGLLPPPRVTSRESTSCEAP